MQLMHFNHFTEMKSRVDVLRCGFLHVGRWPAVRPVWVRPSLASGSDEQSAGAQVTGIAGVSPHLQGPHSPCPWGEPVSTRGAHSL